MISIIRGFKKKQTRKTTHRCREQIGGCRRWRRRVGKAGEGVQRVQTSDVKIKGRLSNSPKGLRGLPPLGPPGSQAQRFSVWEHRQTMSFYFQPRALSYPFTVLRRKYIKSIHSFLDLLQRSTRSHNLVADDNTLSFSPTFWGPSSAGWLSLGSQAWLSHGSKHQFPGRL